MVAPDGFRLPRTVERLKVPPWGNVVNFLHSDLHLGPDEIVVVTLDSQANVLLLDDINFLHYQRGENYTYYGGLAKVSPLHLKPPHPGSWHVVIDLGGYSGTVKASVSTIKV